MSETVDLIKLRRHRHVAWFALSAIFLFSLLLENSVSAGKEPCGLRRQRWMRFCIYAIAVSLGNMLAYQASKKEQNSFNEIIIAVEQANVIRILGHASVHDYRGGKHSLFCDSAAIC